MAKKQKAPIAAFIASGPSPETPDPAPSEGAIVAPHPEPPIATDRAPLGTDNPRHAVLIEEARDGETRKVTVSNPGGHSVNVGGVIYHHTHEAKNGQWVYTRLKPAE